MLILNTVANEVSQIVYALTPIGPQWCHMASLNLIEMGPAIAWSKADWFSIGHKEQTSMNQNTTMFTPENVLQMPCANCRPFCSGVSVLNVLSCTHEMDDGVPYILPIGSLEVGKSTVTAPFGTGTHDKTGNMRTRFNTKGMKTNLLMVEMIYMYV